MVRNTSLKHEAGGEGEGENKQRETAEEFDPETASDADIEGLTKAFAKCKWFNVAKGFGFVTLVDPPPKPPEGKPQPDIFVYQSAIRMPGFRSLREGERVEVWYKTSGKGLEAVRVAGPDGNDCLGSEKRPKRRKKAADRCYNCDDTGHHAKECAHPPLPKKCHHCKSVHHLVANCTMKRDRGVTQQQQTQSSEYEQHHEDDRQDQHHRHHEDSQVHQQQLPQSTNHTTSLPPQATSQYRTQTPNS